MKVEIWSDVVCPWCYIGKRRFEKALRSFDHRDEIELVPAAAHQIGPLGQRRQIDGQVRAAQVDRDDRAGVRGDDAPAGERDRVRHLAAGVADQHDVERVACPLPPAHLRQSSDLLISSTIFLASARSIIVLSS